MISKMHKRLLKILASFFHSGREMSSFQVCPISGSCGSKALVHL